MRTLKASWKLQEEHIVCQVFKDVDMTPKWTTECDRDGTFCKKQMFCFNTWISCQYLLHRRAKKSLMQHTTKFTLGLRRQKFESTSSQKYNKERKKKEKGRVRERERGRAEHQCYDQAQLKTSEMDEKLLSSLFGKNIDMRYLTWRWQPWHLIKTLWTVSIFSNANDLFLKPTFRPKVMYLKLHHVTAWQMFQGFQFFCKLIKLCIRYGRTRRIMTNIFNFWNVGGTLTIKFW